MSAVLEIIEDAKHRILAHQIENSKALLKHLSLEASFDSRHSICRQLFAYGLSVCA
jgi:hypothetical protein